MLTTVMASILINDPSFTVLQEVVVSCKLWSNPFQIPRQISPMSKPDHISNAIWSVGELSKQSRSLMHLLMYSFL